MTNSEPADAPTPTPEDKRALLRAVATECHKLRKAVAEADEAYLAAVLFAVEGVCLVRLDNLGLETRIHTPAKDPDHDNQQ